MYRISVLLGWYLFLAFYGICKSVAEQTPVTFTFKEYQYKDTPKNVSIIVDTLFCCKIYFLKVCVFLSKRISMIYTHAP